MRYVFMGLTLGMVASIVAMTGCRGINETVNESVAMNVNAEINCKEMDYSAYFKGMDATVVFYSPSQEEYRIYNPKLAKKLYSPCSTFKIVSSLMGLDQGVLLSPGTRLGYNGEIHRFPAWNQDVNLEHAFRSSCVWYYIKVMDRMKKADIQRYLTALHYGNINLDAWDAKSHNVFWIESTLKISAIQQVQFLNYVFGGHSMFKPQDVAWVKSFMQYDDVGKFKFYGKTGTGRNYNSGYLEGWFAGMYELPSGEPCYFAVHGADSKRDIGGADVRDILRSIITNFEK